MQYAKNGGDFMPKVHNIPRDLRKPFARLIDLIPAPFRYEEQVQKDILLYLKLEGEEFVRDKIMKSKAIFSKRNQDSV
jgi:hypothetical protein